MSPQEELEQIEIELELRKRKAAQPEAKLPTSAPGPQPAPAGTAPTFSGQGIMEVIRDVPGSAREAIAPLLTAPAKALAGLTIDLPTMGKQWANRKTGGKAFPGVDEMPLLSPKIDELRDALAGRKLGNETPTAAVEGLVGGWGGVAPAIAVNELIKRDVHPLVAMGAGVAIPMAGAAGATAVRAGSVDPRKVMAQGRIEHAVSGTDPAALMEAARTQSLAGREGLFLLPSQGSGRAMPGMAQLETQALMSSAKGAGPLRQQVFSQQDKADELARALVAQAGRPAPVGEAATDLQRAAIKRLQADTDRQRSITNEYYTQAAKNKAPIESVEVKNLIREIDKRIASSRGNEQFVEGATDLRNRLKGLLKEPTGDGGAAVLGKLTGKKTPPVTAPELYNVMKSFADKIEAPDARGVAMYSDNNAKELRKLAENTVRKLYETKEPLYGTARQLTAGMRVIDERGSFDQLTSMTKANSAENLISSVPRQADALQEISRGRTAWADKTKEGTGPMSPMTETVGSDQKAVQKALATALEGARQRAFALGNTGQRNPSASAKFAKEVAGTSDQQEQLLRAINAAGGDTARAGELLELSRAVGRPTVVHGARVPVTDIQPIEGLRMAGGHELARRAAVMRVAQAVVNRMSDGEVIRRLQQPNSAMQLAQMPQIKSATPREQLAVLLAITGQAVPTE